MIFIKFGTIVFWGIVLFVSGLALGLSLWAVPEKKKETQEASK